MIRTVIRTIDKNGKLDVQEFIDPDNTIDSEIVIYKTKIIS